MTNPAISIEHYIATNNKPQAEALLVKYDVPAATSWADLIAKLKYIMVHHSSTALTDLASIQTPYQSLQEKYAPKLLSAPKLSSADGCDCGGKCGCGGNCGKKSGVDATTQVAPPISTVNVTPTPDNNTPVLTITKDDYKKYMPLVTIGGLCLILGIVIAKS